MADTKISALANAAALGGTEQIPGVQSAANVNITPTQMRTFANAGTWAGTAIGATVGGTAQTTYATGDILYASAANTLSKLAAGTNTHVLTLAAGVPSWAAPSGGSGTPGGSDTQVQFNDSSAFGGDAGLTYNKTSNALTMTGALFGPSTYGAGLITKGFESMRDVTPGDCDFYIRPTFYVMMAGDMNFGWAAASPASVGGDSLDTVLNRNAAGVVGVRGASGAGGALNFTEQTAPSAPSANQVVIYAEDNGSGKTRLMARFNTGAAQQIAIEP